MSQRISRRTLLRLGLVGGILLGLEYIRRQTAPMGFDNWLRWSLRGRLAWLAGIPSPVVVTRCPTYQDVADSLHEAWLLLAEAAPALRDRTVVVKPNLVDVLPDRPAHTHPAVVDAVVALCQAHGARRVVVAEGSTFQRDAEALVETSGLGAVLRQRRVPFVDLNTDELVDTPLPGRYTSLGHLLLPRTIIEADLVISVPKMKCHHWAGVSLSMKNMFGVVPGCKYGWPKNVLHRQNLDLSILEIYEAVRPGLAVVDGIVGMEGDGPLLGQARPTGVLVVGCDGVAVDTVASQVMGFTPAQISYLSLAEWVGLGASEPRRIALRGVPVETVQQSYVPPPRVSLPGPPAILEQV